MRRSVRLAHLPGRAFRFTHCPTLGAASIALASMIVTDAPAASLRTVQESAPVAFESSGDSEFDNNSSDWRFEFTPYVWPVSISGDAEIAGNPTSVDADFLDVLDNSDSLIGLMLHLEVGRDRWSVFFNGTYTRIGVEDVPTGAGPADFVSINQWYELGGTWRIHDSVNSGGNGIDRMAVDVLAGVRITDLELEVDISGVGEGDDSKTWADPFIGAQARFHLSDHWRAFVRGDIGGFGIGSDFTWQVIATLGYAFELFDCPATVFAGYRALGQDYEDGQFGWDVIVHGPLIGLSIEF